MVPHRLLAVVLAGVLLVGCAGERKSLRTTLYEGEDPSSVVVLLPGLLATDRTFARKGFVDAAREAGVRADLLAVRTNVLDYPSGRIVRRLRSEVIAPLRARYDRVSVVGISLGGFGALRTAVEHPDAFDEVVVLSPFLGRRAILDRIELDGGLGAWRPPPTRDWDVELWRWIERRGSTLDELPPVWLGYARRDWIVGSPGPLSDLVVAERQGEGPTGHRWRTWKALIGDLAAGGALEAGPAEAPAVAGGR